MTLESTPARHKVQVHLFRPGEDGERLWLALRRGAEKGRVWQCVTGNVEADEKFESAAMREVEEETGLSLTGPTGEIWTYEFLKRGQPFIEHVFGFRALSGPLRLSHEHEAGEWLPLDQAVARFHFEGIREGLRRVARHLDSLPEG